MNALELKGSLTDLIASVKDSDLLEELYQVVRETIQKKKSEPDWWDGLTSEQQKELDGALKASYDESNWVTDDEAQSQIRQWLDK